jgi:hypothetical protein
MDWKRFSNPWEQQPPHGDKMMSRDGKLYIVKEYALDADGLVRKMWWPTGVRARDYFDDFPADGYPARSSGDGVYEVNTGFPRPFQIRLTQGGKTQAEFVEERSVPPPKVRAGVELTWDSVRGVWLKASKSTKWQRVTA